MSLGTKISVSKAQRALKRKSKSVKITQLPATKKGTWSKLASAIKKRRYDADAPF